MVMCLEEIKNNEVMIKEKNIGCKKKIKEVV